MSINTFPPQGVAQRKMNDQAANYGAIGLTALNIVLGIINMDTLNIVVAVLGIISMLLANAYKIVVAVIQLRNLVRNKWRLPSASRQDEDKE